MWHLAGGPKGTNRLHFNNGWIGFMELMGGWDWWGGLDALAGHGTWDVGNGIDALRSATYKVPCIPLRCMIF